MVVKSKSIIDISIACIHMYYVRSEILGESRNIYYPSLNDFITKLF